VTDPVYLQTSFYLHVTRSFILQGGPVLNVNNSLIVDSPLKNKLIP